MTMTSKISSDLLKKIHSGDRKVLSRLLSSVEELDHSGEQKIISSFLKLKNRPIILGLTGTPGAGKSTFLKKVLKHKNKSEHIGLLLIDPSNPMTGGAILGDRIRMTDFFLDPSIFIRSISNRGQIDGLNPFLELYLMVMCHYPFKYIFIETVGGGQSNVNIFSVADKSFLIYDPSSGDSIQHLKSGVLDLADEIIISKADLINTDLVKESLLDSLSKKVSVSAMNLEGNSKEISNFIGGLFSSGFSAVKTDKITRSFLQRKMFLDLKGKIEAFLEISLPQGKISEKFIRELPNNFLKYFCQNR